MKRCLYIFAGQRAKEYLNDFIMYYVDEKRIEVIIDGSRKDSSYAGRTETPVTTGISHIRHFLKDPSKRTSRCNMLFLGYDTIYPLSPLSRQEKVKQEVMPTLKAAPPLLENKYNFLLEMYKCLLGLFSVPAAGFTQRATLDPDNDEIHVLSVSSSFVVVMVMVYKCLITVSFKYIK